MSNTEFNSYMIGDEHPGNPSRAIGDLLSVIEKPDNWRAVIDVDIEAANERDAEEAAQEIVDALSEIGDIDPVYTEAMCPDCARILRGSKEPGDEAICRESGREVELIEVPEKEQT